MLPFMFAPIAFLAIFGTLGAQMAGVEVPAYALILGFSELTFGVSPVHQEWVRLHRFTLGKSW
jgi:hypothetical protein